MARISSAILDLQLLPSSAKFTFASQCRSLDVVRQGPLSSPC